LPAAFTLLLATWLATPTLAAEPSDGYAARKAALWQSKSNARTATGITLKDTSSNLKWRPYRKQPAISNAARLPQATVSPAASLPQRTTPQQPTVIYLRGKISPSTHPRTVVTPVANPSGEPFANSSWTTNHQRGGQLGVPTAQASSQQRHAAPSQTPGAVRLIAADPTRDRLVLQAPPNITRPNRLPPPPLGIELPKSVTPGLRESEPKIDPFDKLPSKLYPKDDKTDLLPNPKDLPGAKDLPDISPKDKQPIIDPTLENNPAADPQVKPREDLPSKKDAQAAIAKKYRLSRIGELSIDITPAADSHNWDLKVDEQTGRLVVKDEKEKGFTAVLVDVLDGQVTLREMVSKKGPDDVTPSSPTEGRLFTYPVEKLAERNRDYVNKRLDKKVWTHRSGDYELDAIFVRLRGWLVDLRTNDGEIVSLPLDEFSLEDQQAVLEFWGLPKTHQQPQVEFAGRHWAPIDYTWTASALCHKPLYFEQVQLERYGHSLGPYLQPLASGAHFFLSVPTLPYKMGVNPPNECVYALGYYRPGSCAPYLVPPLPISLRGAIYQGGIATGLAFLIP
jgi:hypothetical protein